MWAKVVWEARAYDNGSAAGSDGGDGDGLCKKASFVRSVQMLYLQAYEERVLKKLVG